MNAWLVGYLLMGVVFIAWIFSYHDKWPRWEVMVASVLVALAWPFAALYLYLQERQMRRRVLEQFAKELADRAKAR